jgi:hypothetical protein
MQALLGLLACLALQAADGSRAGATCGDWLAHPVGDTTMTDGGATGPQQQGSGGAARDERDSQRLPGSGPCRGPHCERAPLQPTPAGPAIVTFPVERLAVVGRAEARPNVRRQFFVGGDADVRPDRGFPQRIDHPPRA